ncbi:MAG: type IV toxin-antitoxin system AbiEi family antitoxin domain-containing protein [Methanosarcinales archaeon]|nr:type IV toxin-antitoxin system AbiEi family antitoxin domain-containing protein [Methanosarcinales archaeon]
MRNSILDELSKRSEIFTVEDALKTCNINRSVLWVILSRLEKMGWIERIEKGKYIIIPLGAKKGRYTLHEFIIGSLLVEPYCIAYWSALHYYGLTEQIPTTVFMQTISRKKKQTIEVFGIRYKIIKVKKDKFFGIKRGWLEKSKINITDKEKTIIDCLDKPQYCGGVIEVIKALNDKELDKEKLSEYAQLIGNTGVVRRLGYLCDRAEINIDLPRVGTRNYLSLDPTFSKNGLKNAKWKLIINLDEKMLEGLY